MKLWVFILRRFLVLVPVLVGVVTITFIIISAIPLNQRLAACIPPGRHGYPDPGTAAWNNLLKFCGLGGPVWVQYGNYLYNTFTGHWGYVSSSSALRLSVPQIGSCALLNSTGNGGCLVMTLVINWLPYTLELAALSLAITLLLSLPVGNRAAAQRDRPFDQGARIFSFSGYAFPSYLLAALAIIGIYFVLSAYNPSGGCEGNNLNQILGSWPGSSTQGAVPACYIPASYTPGASESVFWGGRPPFANAIYGTSPTGFPTVDAILYASTHTPPPGFPRAFYWDLVEDHLLRLILPALTIAYGTVAGILRFVRNSMLEVLNLDYIRTARAKGVSERKVLRIHAGRSSLNVTLTILGLTFAGFLGGFAITESLFGQFGVGELFAYAFLYPPDIGTIFASTVLFTIIIVVANLAVDILYAVMDPRVRLG